MTNSFLSSSVMRVFSRCLCFIVPWEVPFSSACPTFENSRALSYHTRNPDSALYLICHKSRTILLFSIYGRAYPGKSPHIFIIHISFILTTYFYISFRRRSAPFDDSSASFQAVAAYAAGIFSAGNLVPESVL